MQVTVLLVQACLVAVAAVQSDCPVTGFMLSSWMTDLFAIEITQLHTFTRHSTVSRGCKK